MEAVGEISERMGGLQQTFPFPLKVAAWLEEETTGNWLEAVQPSLPFSVSALSQINVAFIFVN